MGEAEWLLARPPDDLFAARRPPAGNPADGSSARPIAPVCGPRKRPLWAHQAIVNTCKTGAETVHQTAVSLARRMEVRAHARDLSGTPNPDGAAACAPP